MSNAKAWLLNLGEDLHAAVGERELRYLLADPPRFNAIPHAPSYCRNVFIWQGAILPVMDLAQRILGRKIFRSTVDELVVLATFQENSNAPLQHGALLLGDIPAKIEIDDAQACPLPEPKLIWQQLARACFKHETKGSIPVLDLAKVFLTTAIFMDTDC